MIRENIELSETQTKIPDKIITLLERMEKLFGVEFEYEPCFQLYARGGFPYAKGEAVVYSVCTFSFADGADYDYSKEIKEILCNIGFSCHGEGDNGLDPVGSYGRDTYWNYHFMYKPTFEYLEDD